MCRLQNNKFGYTCFKDSTEDDTASSRNQSRALRRSRRRRQIAFWDRGAAPPPTFGRRAADVPLINIFFSP